MNSPYYKGTEMWNALDVDMQKSTSILDFAKKLKKLYIRYQEIW